MDGLLRTYGVAMTRVKDEIYLNSIIAPVEPAFLAAVKRAVTKTVSA